MDRLVNWIDRTMNEIRKKDDENLFRITVGHIDDEKRDCE